MAVRTEWRSFASALRAAREWAVRFWAVPVNRRNIGIAAAALFGIAFFSGFFQLWRMVDQRLREGVLADTVNVYAGPRTVAAGDAATLEEVVGALRKSGYTGDRANPIGSFTVSGNVLEIRPGPDSYFKPEAARVTFQGSQVSEVRNVDTGEKIEQYALEPQLLLNLTGESRERRRPLSYEDIPANLRHALLSIEDKRFFDHWGFDVPRLVKVVLVNLRAGRKEQGGSTLTMQLARSLYLDQAKTWRRKITESFITLILELKLSKEEIFTYYCNEIYLGRRETFNIHGFGEAARAFFNKEVRDLTLPEAAVLAGIVQRPSYFDPVRNPNQALERRGTVLSLMERNGYITRAQYDAAVRTPLGVSSRRMDLSDAPYFVALAADDFKTHYNPAEGPRGQIRIYTTVDQRLQEAAVEAVRIGMERVDQALKYKKGKPAGDPPGPQVALVALDPHTGEVKAAVGGRAYGSSQLNHVLSKRQPGSVFKAFVYAAALETQLNQKGVRLHGGSVIEDVPKTFKFGDEIYEPGNYGEEYSGSVTMRQAITRSLNIPTISIAQMVGYKRVADLARRAGLKTVRGTPAMALGSYESTPLEMAGAWTTFANEGEAVEPIFFTEVRSATGKLLYAREPKRVRALDPRVNFLARDLLQDVVRYGTAAGLYSYGLYVPIAGKTGTSRDGWFAGFTSDLLCVVWVGFDDNRELELEGARSALPIWGEFMRRALKLGYQGANFPNPPAGLTSGTICQDSGLIATPYCPRTRGEYFIAGAAPGQECDLHTHGEPAAAPTSGQN